MRRAFCLVYLALLPLVMFLTGCEDENVTSLEGTWCATTLILVDNSAHKLETSLPETWTEILSLHPDGTFSYDTTQDGRTESGAGRWSRTEDQLTFSSNGEGHICYGIEGNHLVLTGDIPEGHFTLVWTKIN